MLPSLRLLTFASIKIPFDFFSINFNSRVVEPECVTGIVDFVLLNLIAIDWTPEQACVKKAALNNGFKKIELGATLPGVPLYEAMGYHAVTKIDVPMHDGEILEVIKMERILICE